MKKKTADEILIVKIKRGEFEVCVLGTTPLIQHRLPEKARQELLAPKGRKSSAEKKGSLKHDPIEEFHASPYISGNVATDSLLEMPAVVFKKATAAAALDIPGASKAEISRLVWVQGERVPIYGTPKLFMSVVRCADRNRTPDIRTRCIVPQWATRLRLTYTEPILNQQTVANLLAASGVISGVGDWRPQKGGNYGQFEIVSSDHPEFLRLVKNEGRAHQEAAMKKAEPYDSDTEELLAWFGPEMKRRGFEVAS